MKPANGFTLLELLVAISLLGMLILGLSPALRLSGQAWDSVLDSGDRTEMLRAAQNFLRMAISQSYPAALIDEDGHRTLAYQGEPDSLAMVTSMPSRLGLGGLQIVHISVRDSNGIQELVAGWTPLPPDQRQFTLGGDQREVVLARGVEALHLTYFGSEAADEAPRWNDRWANSRRLPTLVALRVTFRDGTAWPDLLAQPMIDLAAMVTR